MNFFFSYNKRYASNRKLWSKPNIPKRVSRQVNKKQASEELSNFIDSCIVENFRFSGKHNYISDFTSCKRVGLKKYKYK